MKAWHIEPVINSYHNSATDSWRNVDKSLLPLSALLVLRTRQNNVLLMSHEVITYFYADYSEMIERTSRYYKAITPLNA